VLGTEVVVAASKAATAAEIRAMSVDRVYAAEVVGMGAFLAVFGNIVTDTLSG